MADVLFKNVNYTLRKLIEDIDLPGEGYGSRPPAGGTGTSAGPSKARRPSGSVPGRGKRGLISTSF